MKKLVLLLSISCFWATRSNAQRIQIGPEIGVNWAKFNVDDPGIDEDDFSSRAGLKIGGIVDIGFDRHFSFQPGLFFNQKGSRDRYSYDLPGGNRVFVSNKYRVNYMEIPMNFQLKFGHPYRGQFFIGAGPYIAFAVGGEVDLRSTIRDDNGNSVVYENESYDLEIGDDAGEDDVKGMDAGLNANLGFMAPRGFFIRGNAGIGLANIRPGGDEDYSTRNFCFSLTAGFLFGH